MADSLQRDGNAPPERSFVHGNEAVVVILLFAVAILSAYAVIRASIVDGEKPPMDEPARAQVSLPARIPYEDLIRGEVTRLGGGRVSVTYDFEAVPKVEGRVFADVDLYPQLEDWNLAIPGSRVRTGIVRGEGRLMGEARSRLAFAGPVEVRAQLEILSGRCAIQLCTNTAEEGYEIRIDEKGAVSMYARPAAKERRKKDDPPPELVKLAGPTQDDAGLVGRIVEVRAVRDEKSLRLTADGRDVLSVELADPHAFPVGNIALRATGRSYWDDVRLVGTLDRAWLEDRLYTAVSLVSRDMYERDNSWTTAREILADGEVQNRTLYPEGDVDWVAVAVLDEARAVSVTIDEVRFGIVPVIAAFEVDGVTPVAGDSRQRGEAGALSLRITTEGRSAFYVRIAGNEDRCGTYTLKVAGAQ